MSVTAYQVIQAPDPAGMATLAAAAIAAGWQPFGEGYSRQDNMLCQAFNQGALVSATKFLTEAGAGITDGVGTVYKSSVVVEGGIIRSSILLDLTGLSSATSDLDIIGVGTAVAHLGQITAAEHGTILSGRMTCLEVPASLNDIDLYAATVGTGVFEDGIAALVETALVTAGAAWTLGLVKPFTGIPAANTYLYLVNGAVDTADPFTAGKFLIEMEGYVA